MKLKVGIIGFGYWGPNYLRNFLKSSKYDVIWVCDLSKEALKKLNASHPNIKLTNNFRDILDDVSINLVAVATPPETHYDISKEALNAKKHLLVGKPLTTSSQQTKELIKIAKRNKLLLYGDLTYLYSNEIFEIKNLINRNKIGKSLYFDSIRTNLGILRKDVNVIWDLAPHDLSIIEFCFRQKPQTVFAVASKHFKNSINEETAHITITYTNNLVAHIHVSWVSPIKVRTIVIGGSKKMIVYDDQEPENKIKIYDKGVDIPNKTFKPVYRNGKFVTKRITSEEALFSEINDIAKQIEQRKISYFNTDLNLSVIKLLEACDLSIKLGRQVNL